MTATFQITTAAGGFDGSGRTDLVFQRGGTFELARYPDLPAGSMPQTQLMTCAMPRSTRS